MKESYERMKKRITWNLNGWSSAFVSIVNIRWCNLLTHILSLVIWNLPVEFTDKSSFTTQDVFHCELPK